MAQSFEVSAFVDMMRLSVNVYKVEMGEALNLLCEFLYVLYSYFSAGQQLGVYLAYH